MSGDQGQGRGLRSGAGVKVGMVGVRRSVGFSRGGGGLEINRECSFQELMIEFHSIPFQSIPFHVLPNAIA